MPKTADIPPRHCQSDRATRLLVSTADSDFADPISIGTLPRHSAPPEAIVRSTRYEAWPWLEKNEGSARGRCSRDEHNAERHFSPLILHAVKPPCACWILVLGLCVAYFRLVGYFGNMGALTTDNKSSGSPRIAWLRKL